MLKRCQLYATWFAVMLTMMIIPLSWLVHVITCVMTNNMALLVVGSAILPIGIIRGFLIILGVNV